jgi:DNA invertase Pin-like site-specific DNA recombinase
MGGSVKQCQMRTGKSCTPPLKRETDAGYFGRLPTKPYAHMFEHDDQQLGGRDQCRVQKAIDALKAGDVLLVTRIDRLARSTRDLLNVLHQIAEKGGGFKSLGDPMIDTTSPHGRLLLQIMGALAEFERSMILARTSEGRARALERGVKFGRKSKLTPFQKREVLNRVANGESHADLARVFAVNPSTIYGLIAASANV